MLPTITAGMYVYCCVHVRVFLDLFSTAYYSFSLEHVLNVFHEFNLD